VNVPTQELGNKKAVVPLILQSEAAECGLACGAMIAGYYGHNVSLVQLRSQLSISLKGVDLKGLMYCADSLNFNTRPIRIEMEELSQLKLPAVVHFDFQHFVVLTKVTGKYLYVNDPALGECRFGHSEFSERFTGIALEFFPNEGFKSKKKKTELPLFKLFENHSGIKRLLTQIFCLSMFLQVFVLLLPYFSQIVIDKVLVSHDVDFLTVLGCTFLLLGIFKGINLWLRGSVIIYLSSNLSVQLMSQMFRRLLGLHPAFFEKRHIGDIQSRFSSLSHLQETMTTELIAAIVDGLMAIATVIVMYIYSPLLATVTMSAIAIYAIFRRLTYNQLRKALEEQLTSKAKTDSIFLESIRGIIPIKNHAIEPKRVSIWLNSFVRSVNADVKTNKLQLSYTVLFESVSYMELIILVWIAVYAILANEFSVGMLLAFLTFRQNLVMQAQSLIEKWFELRLLDVHLTRVSDIVLSKPEDNYEGIGINNELADLGDIKLTNVDFKYADNEQWVLKNINLHIKSKECVAIVGKSGAGKSTLLKVMLGLLTPQNGEVKLNDIDISKIGLKNYRRIIAVVMQDDSLFSGSIRDNVTMFDPAPDEVLLIKCIKSAYMTQDINEMPMGLYSLVGDMGSSLSGGQKQRLLIARALYKQPDIVFFDESTCHLDAIAERKINRAIKKMGITRIMIAHREETILLADRVIDIELLNKAEQDEPDKQEEQQTEEII
jgi:ATP-binding cassette subfamily B protein RaxB